MSRRQRHGREAEVDDPRHPVPVEQHVVAEEVAMNRAARQLQFGEPRLKLDLAGDELRHFVAFAPAQAVVATADVMVETSRDRLRDLWR